MTVKLKTPSNGSVSLTPQDTASDVVVTVPAATGTVNTSGVVNEVPAGSASAPAIYPTGDTNTGIFFPAADTIAFSVGGAGAMRVDSSGNLLVGTTDNNLGGTSYGIALRTPSGGQQIRINTSGSTDTNIAVFRTNGSDVFRVATNGGIANFSANNTNLSDRREKTNFAPAGEYLSKICSIPVQTYNYLNQNMEDDPGLTLGVVAQDVQAVAPELVTESNWGTEYEPKMRLSIYQTDLQYALMKCIQEQQAIINSLQDRITALENA